MPTSFVVSLVSTLKDIPTASSETLPSFTNACFSLFNAVCRSTQSRLQHIPTLRRKFAKHMLESRRFQPKHVQPKVAEWTAEPERFGGIADGCGESQVKELIENLPEAINKQVRKTECNLVSVSATSKPDKQGSFDAAGAQDLDSHCHSA